MLSSVGFGVILSLLSWSIPYLLPAGLLPVYVLIASLVLLTALGFVAFKLILPSLKISQAVDWYLAHDMRTGSVLSPIIVNYSFWSLADQAFQELTKSNPNYGEALKQPFSLQDNLLAQFMSYSILAWLVKLPSTTLFSAYRTRVPIAPSIYRETKEKMQEIDPHTFDGIIGGPFVSLQGLKARMLSKIRLPKSMRLRADKDKLVMSNRYVKIRVGYHLNSWFRGLDLATQKILGISDDDAHEFGSLDGVVTFEATLKSLATLLPNADRYWNFAKEAAKNLTANYSWSFVMRDVKEMLTWNMLAKHNDLVMSR